MKRWAFNIIAAGSLALGLLTAGLWVRSYWHMNAVSYNAQSWYIQIANPKGQVWLWRHTGGSYDGSPGWRHDRHRTYDLQVVYGPPHWKFGPVEGWRRFSYRFLAIRCWALVLLFSLPPSAWLLRGPLLRRRRVKLGLCRHCGYDLRATPGRCPECGEPGAGGR